jgi:lipid II:glycine glycyltransferase (peptidoglycan interpeptide bridge formation enzyme)
MSLILQPVTAERRKQWDDFVAQHPNGHLLQTWGWGELKAGIGWYPIRFALCDVEQQQMMAAAQVLCRPAGRLPLRAGHFAYIPKGPVLDWSQPLLCDALFSQLNHHLGNRGALALRIELPQEANIAGSEDIRTRVISLGFHPAPAKQPVRTILLNLAPNEETLLARMKEKWRYNVRLAARKGVTVRVAQSADDVRAWYKLLQTTSERDKFGIHTLAYYLQAWQIFATCNQARLLLAEYQGQLLGGIFVALLAKQAIYLYGASANEQRHLMPNYLLQWEAIRWARQEGAALYDFWGIPATDDDDEDMAGVYRFKRGWGGEIVSFLGAYEHDYHPFVMRLASKLLSL